MRSIAPAFLVSALLIAGTCAEQTIIIEKAEREVCTGPFVLYCVMTLLISWCHQLHECLVSLLCAFQYDASKHIVIARETLTFKNEGSEAVGKLVLCQPADLVPNRAFHEVTSTSTLKRMDAAIAAHLPS